MFTCLSPGAIGVRASLPEAIALAQRHGFQGLDFNVGEAARLADERGVDHVCGLFDEAGVRPGSFGLPVRWNGDEQQWRSGLDALPRLAQVASQLGCRRAATWCPPASDERPFDENWQWHLVRLRPIAAALRDAGIRFGIEFIGPKTLRAGKRYEFIHTMDGMLQFCRALGTGNVGLLLDAWHWYTSHGTLDDLRRLTRDDVVVVHVNDAPAGVPVDEQIDSVRTLPVETGVIDLPGFLRALEACGYDGPVIVEPFSERVRNLRPEQAAAETAHSLQRAFAAASVRPGN